jgi:hypothetical protein
MAMNILEARAKHLHSMLFTKEGDNSADQWEAHEIQEMVDELRYRFTQCDEQYVLVIGADGTTPAQIKKAEDIYQKVSDANIRGKLTLRRRLNQLNPPGQNALANPGNNMLRIVKEREPSVTKFNGADHAWPAFRDMFSAEVHNRQDIEPLAELTYLKTACVGRAADALGIWGHTAANYQLAWDVLNKRYENQHNIKQATITKLFSLPRLDDESYDGLNHMVNMVDSLSRQLGDMHVPVNQWDDVIFNMIMERLTNVTITAWKQAQDRDAQRTLAQLLTFTGNRAAACQLQRNGNAQNNGKVNKVQNQKGQTVKNNRSDNNGTPVGQQPPFKKQAFNRRFRNHSPEQNVSEQPSDDQSSEDDQSSQDDQSTEPDVHDRQTGRNQNKDSQYKTFSPCRMCNGKHYLIKCYKFLALTVEKRIELAKDWDICAICFRIHNSGECKWTGCVHCQGNHHVINCPVKSGK